MSMHLCSREKALKANTSLAKAVLEFQKWADPSLDPWEIGQEVVVDLETDESIFLDATTCAQWNERDKREYDRVRDHLPMPDNMKMVDQIIAFAEADDEAALFQANAESWVALCEKMDWGSTWFVGVMAHPFLDQDNDHPPMQEAHDRLIEMGLKKGYTGAIRADGEELLALMRDFAALARFNASAPYVFFAADGSSTACAFCKYVNYHLDTYTEAEDRKLREQLAKAGFATSQDGRCYEPFSEDGAIEGRRLDISKL